MISLLAAALLVTTSACSPLQGAEVLWRPGTRFIIVGELHGTSEAPAAFAQLVCSAAEQGPVTVAVELPATMQPQLDAFINASDATAAEAILRDTQFWNLDRADGRTSVAMLEMLQSVRRLKAEGRDIAFRAFQPTRSVPENFSQNYYELDMAAELSEGAISRPQARMLVLVGNIHASKRLIESFDLLPAAAHLPAGEVVSLFVAEQGGQAWNCTNTCGPREVLSVDTLADGVTLRSYRGGRYDGVIGLGAATASPPAAEVGETLR